jgi:tetratricopeptide (TPR) repeat protein
MEKSNLHRLIVALTLAGAVLAAVPRAALGHADIEVRIADLTKKIEANPTNAELFIKRGELHRVHRDWEAAMADYRRAAEIVPRLSAVHFLRGRMLFEAGRPQEAIVDLDRFLAIASSDVGLRREALVTRARVRVELGKFLEAAEDYTGAIATLTRHTPEYYLERSQALSRAGLLGRALQGVDEAIARSGPLVTLQFYAIELELDLERYDDALARLGVIARWMPAERLLFRRGEILRRAGRINEARRAYLAALEVVETASPPRRSTRAMQDLGLQLRCVLDQLSER